MATLKEEQSKMHGDKLSEAVKGGHVDAVPGDDKAHAHSHAAHLAEEGKVHLGAENIGKQGREAGTEDHPPQNPTRDGRTHTRQ
ncbi:hypothetical protein Terro_2580 [Terriglobus roseus DSM 18391]|uniref:Uncharacterized protein n=1 Tax=Terriglobus roseus (strain DSM 18391 / NRRL B-41598 / KBS 63) TaxID=926566 RepID=I3ZHV4_TERRK|nr:hypothetical protein [Terriglobus roseus]AFL88481.1 hypothetical protein Terro_2216 [Terriglobus roseus DSM 18391]AFL88822.1 hypothetical protein Terro_2580 [Terriglobus roseus DSM 18391]